jgi:modification methylase
MFSFVGDTVLDPFWGIGNTTLAAMEMHRSSIGFEIEPKYFRIGRDRMRTLLPDSTIEFISPRRRQAS